MQAAMAGDLDLVHEITNEGSGESEGCLMQAMWLGNMLLLFVNVIVWGSVLWVL